MKKKNIALILTVVATMGIMAGCKKDETPKVEAPVETPIETPVVQDVEAIEITFAEDLKLMSKIYDATANTITYAMENKTGFNLSYGSPFELYRKTDDGKFVKTNYTDNLAFDAALKTADVDQTIHETIDLNLIKESMSDGIYYIIKPYDNGDGTEAGKMIPQIYFEVKAGKYYEVKADSLNIDAFPSYFANDISFKILDTDKKLTVALDGDFFKLNEDKSFTEVDFGFEEHGLFGESIVGEEYVGLFEFKDIALDESHKGLYELRINYSSEDGNNGQIIIQFAINESYAMDGTYTIFMVDEYMSQEGIEENPFPNPIEH